MPNAESGTAQRGELLSCARFIFYTEWFLIPFFFALLGVLRVLRLRATGEAESTGVDLLFLAGLGSEGTGEVATRFRGVFTGVLLLIFRFI